MKPSSFLRPEERRTSGIEGLLVYSYWVEKSHVEDLFLRWFRGCFCSSRSTVLGRLGLICIRRVVLLLRKFDVIERGTRLEVSFNGSLLAGLSESFM